MTSVCTTKENNRGEGGNVIQVRVTGLKLMHSEPTQTAG